MDSYQLEDHVYKYIDKVFQVVTTVTSEKNYSIDFIPKNVKKSDFLSFLYGKPLREYEKSKFKTGERLRICMYDLPFRKG